MSPEDRDKMISFCVAAEAELHGVDPSEVDPRPFSRLTDDALVKEADWYDDLLNK